MEKQKDFFIEIYSYIYVLQDLQSTKINKQEINKYMENLQIYTEKISNYINQTNFNKDSLDILDKKKVDEFIKLNTIINIEDLKLNKEKLDINKEDLEFKYIISKILDFNINDNITEDCNAWDTKEDKEIVENYLWVTVKILMYIYEKYEIYLNNKKSQLNMEVEIIKKIINFTNYYNNLNKKLNLNPENIYETLLFLNDKEIFFNINRPYCYSDETLYKEIKKIDNNYYLYIISTKNSYEVIKINNFSKFKKLQVVLRILQYNIIKGTHGYNLMHGTRLMNIYDKYSHLLREILSKEKTIHNF